jgi:predicted N-acetyltransferase YhbS
MEDRDSSAGSIELRSLESSDLATASRILYEAFQHIHDFHRFPGAYPSPEIASRAVQELVGLPSIWGVAAEVDGRFAGSTFVDERGPIYGFGPLSVDRSVQARGVGRRLMHAMIDRASDARGARFTQDAFNRGALGLYVTVGFDVREPLVLVAGRPRSSTTTGCDVRPLDEADVDECEQLCRKVLGFERTAELREALSAPSHSPFVAVRDGRVVAYTTTLTYYPAGYAVALEDVDMSALITGASNRLGQAASFLLPTREHALFRWCMTEGLRIVKPMTYLTSGEYADPEGCWIPSAVY